MADWVTISALATAGGTFALDATTYGSVRSANRAARTAERSLLAELRPLIVESSEQDPPQHVNFVDVHSITATRGGFWQIAYREEQRDELDELLPGVARGELAAEVLYGDFEGGQRVISGYRLLRGDDDR